MVATTQILPFATLAAGSGGTRLTPTAYAALTTLLANGFQVGIADEFQVNTVLAQASFIAAGIAEFCVSQGVSVPDDGNLTNLVSEITSALTTLINATTPGTTLTIPVQTKTGSGYSFATADNSYLTKRTNSGSAMADTLPGTSGALAVAWYGYIQNTDSAGPLSMGVGSGGTIAVGSAATANAFVIYPGETWLVISYGTGNYTAFRLGTSALHTSPTQGEFKNLKGVWASSTGTTWTADELVLEDSASNTKKIKSFNKTIATGTSGAGGIDTGSVASSTWYFVYAILNPTSNTQAILFSLSATAPTLPSGYTYSALIGVFRTDGSSNIIGFLQKARLFRYVVGNNLGALPQMASGSSGNPSTPTWTAVAVANFSPSIASSIDVALWSSTTSGAQSAAAPNNSYGGNGSSSNPPPLAADSANSGAVHVTPARFALEGSNIYYAANANGGALYCMGFEINL